MTKTIVNKPPKSKLISIVKQNKNIKFCVKESIKGKWKFFTVEHTSDKLDKQLKKCQTIAEQIAIRNRLVDAGTVESFLHDNSSYKNTAENRNQSKKKKK